MLKLNLGYDTIPIQPCERVLFLQEVIVSVGTNDRHFLALKTKLRSKQPWTLAFKTDKDRK